ncbi:MAG: hypothetical protein ABIG71_04890 [Candidatus Uhrbacteria bacterium]
MAPAIVVAASFVILVHPVSAQIPAANNAPAGETAGAAAQGGLNTTATAGGLLVKSDLTVIIGKVIQAAISLVGVIFLILMIYGGIRWMTAQGSSEIVKKAKDTITAAIIGIVIVGLAFALTNFILKALIEATK